MAEITKELRTFLRSDANILTAFGERIAVVKIADESAYPFAIIRMVYPSANYIYDGRWGNEDVVQIDVYDDDIVGCSENAQLIENRLDGYAGPVGSVPNCLALITQSHTEEWAPDARHYRSLMQINLKWTTYE